MNRRTLLKMLSAGAAGAAASQPFLRALADPTASSSEFFLFIHAAGGWDVTVWADPRNKPDDKVQPTTAASVEGLDNKFIKLWKPGPGGSFEMIEAGGHLFGPGIGDLLSLQSRFCLLNGVSMATVSHPDGTYYSSTGRHLAGGHPTGPSIDTLLSNEFGQAQLLPTVSVSYPTTFIGSHLADHALPIRVSRLGGLKTSIDRSPFYETPGQRSAVTKLLAEEAHDLATRSREPAPFRAFERQFHALDQLLTNGAASLFDSAALLKTHAALDPAERAKKEQVIYLDKAREIAANSAFAVEAFRRRLVRSLSFSVGNFDSHGETYRQHTGLLQTLFDRVTELVNYMDTVSFEGSSDKLSDHVHIVITSDFSRSPDFDGVGGRGHNSNNSTLILSPRFKGGTVFGRSDPGQLLAAPVPEFAGGQRPINPADVLATVLTAAGVDPAKYLRDGEVIAPILAPVTSP